MEGVNGINFDDFRNKEVGLWGEGFFIDLGAGAFVASAKRRNASVSASFVCFLSALSTAACVRCSCSSSVIVDIVITVLSLQVLRGKEI